MADYTSPFARTSLRTGSTPAPNAPQIEMPAGHYWIGDPRMALPAHEIADLLNRARGCAFCERIVHCGNVAALLHIHNAAGGAHWRWFQMHGAYVQCTLESPVLLITKRTHIAPGARQHGASFDTSKPFLIHATRNPKRWRIASAELEIRTC